MHLKKTFKSALDFIFHQGVSDTNQDEIALTILTNQAAFFTTLGAVSAYFVTYLFPVIPNTYRYIILILMIMYSLIIFLQGIGKILAARIYVTNFLTVWIYGFGLLFGGFYSQSIASLTTIIIAYVFFKKRKTLRLFTILHNIIAYIGVNLYLGLHPPLFKSMSVPFDEIMVYLIAFVWVYVFLQIYENEKDEWILNLANKNEELEQKKEELERFTHIASHDLKSPLRNIISFLGLMERDIRKNNYENIGANLEYAKSGAYQLNALIQDISMLSNLNYEEAHFLENLDLNYIVKNALGNLADDIKNLNAEIIVKDLPSISGKKLELTVLFQNLIQNGIKYNESDNPRVELWTEINDDRLKVFFKDNGIGIEKEYHEQIFTYFKRLHSSDKYSGTGLGLGLCKKIVQGMNGNIMVESEYGKGSLFTVVFPSHIMC